MVWPVPEETPSRQTTLSPAGTEHLRSFSDGWTMGHKVGMEGVGLRLRGWG